LIYNGRVVASGQLSADKLELTLDNELPLDRTGWVAARVNGPPVPEFAVGPQQAHTNPVYIELAGSTSTRRPTPTTSWPGSTGSKQT
jgi:hypothetical protein